MRKILFALSCLVLAVILVGCGDEKPTLKSYFFTDSSGENKVRMELIDGRGQKIIEEWAVIEGEGRLRMVAPSDSEIAPLVSSTTAK